MNKLFVLCMLFFCFFGLSAQAGVILYADGSEIRIQREGETIVLDPYYDQVIGLPLFTEDVILTSDSTFLEVQMLPGENLLKIAENTTFKLSGFTESGGGTFDVFYGRVRAKVEKLTVGDRFQIRSDTAVCGVRGTDFGVDIIIDPDVEEKEAQVQVYCFEGEVAVAQLAPDSEIDIADIENILEVSGVVIEADEMVVVEESKVPEVVEVAEEVNTYWTENEFEKEARKDGKELLEQIKSVDIEKMEVLPIEPKKELPVRDSAESDAPEYPGLEMDIPDPANFDEEPRDNTMLVAGGIIFGAGLLVEAAALVTGYALDNDDLAGPLSYGGYVLMGTGAVFTVVNFLLE